MHQAIVMNKTQPFRYLSSLESSRISSCTQLEKEGISLHRKQQRSAPEQGALQASLIRQFFPPKRLPASERPQQPNEVFHYRIEQNL